MLVDCDQCAVRGPACSGCVVTVLLGSTPDGVEWDETERAALGVLADPAWFRHSAGADPSHRKRAAGWPRRREYLRACTAAVHRWRIAAALPALRGWADGSAATRLAPRPNVKPGSHIQCIDLDGDGVRVDVDG